MRITEEEAREIIDADREVRVANCIDRAWQRLGANPDRAAFNLKRTVATVMHQFMMNELRIEFGIEKGVHLVEEHETIRIVFDQRLLVRLKKMDKRGVTAAHHSQALLGFIFPDVPKVVTLPWDEKEMREDLPCVDMGYVLNELGTRIDQKIVAAREGDTVAWSYTFGDAMPMPDAAIPPAPADQPSAADNIIVPDAVDQQKKDGGD
jgi:hypothetical protein